MKNVELNQELIAQGYLAYAFRQGGESPLKFEDNSDIVTDKDVNPIPVTPKGGKEPIPFVPRGSRNDLPYDILRRTAKNVTVGSNIEFKSKVVYGDGILVYRQVRNEATGKWEKQEVTREDVPEIFDFLELNDFGHVRMELANDLCLFYDAYVEYVFDRNDPPRLVQVIPLETACSRISEIDEKEGRSLWHGYSAEWYLGTPTDLVATPLLDRRAPLRDLLTRMGRLPGKNGIAKTGRDRRFVHNLRINTPGRFYYARPYWWSVFASGWYDFSNAIPTYKKALIKNQMSLRYIVYIKDTFWAELFKKHRATDEKAQADLQKKFLDELNDYLTGEENAGKTFVSHFRYDRVKGIEDKDILITPLDNALKGGEYIEDSEETSNTLSYGMGVHPSIIGSSPGKNKSINGTEARELFIITQALMKSFQEATLEPLYFAKRLNGWPDDIRFSVTNVQLTTLDKGTGATKNTGLKPENDEE